MNSSKDTGEGANQAPLSEDEVIARYEEDLATARATGNRENEGVALGSLGVAYRSTGELKKAKDYLAKSLAIFKEIKSPRVNLVQHWLDELPSNKKSDKKSLKNIITDLKTKNTPDDD